MTQHKGLFHLNRQKNLKPKHIEDSELFYLLETRSHAKTWEAAIRIADEELDKIEDGTGEYDWARLSSIFGHQGSATLKNANLVWDMCNKAAKEHPVIVKKMMGVFLMWRFSHRDGWFAYVKDTGKYDKLSEKEITITCYFKKR